MNSYEKEIKELNLLSDGNFGVETFIIPHEWIEEEQRRENECKTLKFKPKKTKQLKAIARTGLSNSVRRRWWFFLSGGFDLYCRVGDIYRYALDNAKETPINEKSNFGISFNLLDFVPPKIASTLPTFLHALWFHNQDVEYSPLIPAISSMLLMFMEPSLAYLCVQSMINSSKDTLFFLLLNKKQCYAQIEAIEKLITIKLPNVSNHARKLGIELPQLILSVFPSFFIPFMSLPISLTLFDSFISEGRKIFFRFIMQILNDEKYNLVNTSDSNEFSRLIFNAIDRINNLEVMKRFIKKAFQLKLKRKNHIEKLEKLSSHSPNEMPLHIDFTRLHINANHPNSLNELFNHRRTKTFDAKFAKKMELRRPGNSAVNQNALSTSNSNANLTETDNDDGDIDIDIDNKNEFNVNPNLANVKKNKSQKNFLSSSLFNPTASTNNNTDTCANNNTDTCANYSIDTSANNESSIIFINNNNNDTFNNSSFLNNNNSIEALSEHPPLESNNSIASNNGGLNNLKNMHAMVAQRNLPSIYSHCETNLILDEKMLLWISGKLPPIFLHYSADLAFKLSVHGSSFNVLFSKCSYNCQYIMLIKTPNKVFGSFLSDPIQPKYKGRYFGTRMTFVFDLSKLSVYRSKTPTNNYFMSVSDECLMVGGPDPAIYISYGFKKVYSNNCESFRSPILTENDFGDDIIDFEVYRFIPHHIVRQRRKSINSIQKNV